MSAEQNGAPRGFIAAAAFHAHVAVLHFVQASNAVLATNGVELSEDLGRTHLHPVDGHHIAVDKGEFNDLGLVGGLLWAAGEAPHALFGCEIGVFQNPTLITDVQQIGIHGVGRPAFSFLEIHGDAVLVGISEELFAREQVPLSPWGDHFDIGHQGIGTELKAHLVVALASRPVADGVGMGFLRNFHQSLGNQGASNGGAQQVLTFVQSVGPEHGEHKVAHKLLAQIFNENVLGVDAHFDGLGSGRFNLFALTNVGREGHDFAVVSVLQPLQNDGGVEST